MAKPALVRVSYGCLAALALLAFQPSAVAQDIIEVGTDDHTGSYYRGGGGICKLINDGRGEHQMRCRITSSPGGVANINALRRGERDLGFADGELARNAIDASGVFADTSEFSGLRIVTALNHQTVTLVARNNSDIGEIRDLRNGRVNIGAEGSSQRAMMTGLMNAFGWSPQDFRDVRQMSRTEQVDAFCAGELDAVLFIASHPNRGIQDTLNCGGTLLSVSGAAINNMIGERDAYTSAAIDASHYDGVNDEITSYSVVTLLLSSTNTDRNTIYEVTSALYDNLSAFRAWHPGFRDLSTEAMAERTRASSIPLHPGTRMYFDENDL